MLMLPSPTYICVSHPKELRRESPHVRHDLVHLGLSIHGAPSLPLQLSDQILQDPHAENERGEGIGFGF